MKKVMLVTGATDGIGQETAHQLARGGARVLVHGRSTEKVQAVTATIQAEGGDAAGFVADLADLGAVRKLAADVEQATDRLDVLLNNAGVFMSDRKETRDGHEVTFQVNHLAHFLLTNLLLPLLERSAPARIINVSSVAHTRGQLDFDDPDLRRGFEGYRAYAASKLANVLFTLELAERLAGKNVTVNALHPGVIGTKLLREGFGAGGADTETGAQTSVYLATSPEVEGVTGRYFANAQEAQMAPQAKDPDARKRLWTLSGQMTGVGA